MEKQKIKEVTAGFQLILLIFSVFAFSYIISDKSTFFQDSNQIDGIQESQSLGRTLKLLTNIISSKLKEPMIPMVSADAAGCCELTKDGAPCVSGLQSDCDANYDFASGISCATAAFCQTGCCYDDAIGQYDSNVLQSSCSATWDSSNSLCTMDGAIYGCCIIGTSSTYMNQRKCEIATDTAGTDLNWDQTLTEAQCMAALDTEEIGACVDDNSYCTIETEDSCNSVGGFFSKGFLCTAPDLETLCEMTEDTMTMDDSDKVYFKDSCGERGNIYDSTRVSDDTYWNEIISIENSCGSDSLDANAESLTCGNCDRWVGSRWAPALENGMNPTYGDYYCKTAICKDVDMNADGVLEDASNGESWCVYEGVIGNGDDTVGSEHQLHSCIFGEVEKNGPPTDYRSRLCMENKTLNNAGEVIFRKADWAPNDDFECIKFNTEEGLSDCDSNPHCEVTQVDVSSDFKFQMCTPRYPAGFNINDITDVETEACGMATQECYVPMEWKVDLLHSSGNLGYCKAAANANCLKEEFTQKMNNLCRKLGDCGGEANYIGEYTANYVLDNGKDIGTTWIDGLKELAVTIPDQEVSLEEYITYLESFGVAPPENPSQSELFGDGLGFSLGAGGVGLAGYAASAIALESFTLSGLTTMFAGGGQLFSAGYAGASVSAIATVFMGAALGALAGYWASEVLGLEHDAALLMTAAGAAAGAGLTILIVAGAGNAWNPVGWVLLGVAVVAVVAALFIPECEDITVKFECNVWSPPVGGDDCDRCNDEGTICSEYKCNSLGAACVFLNGEECEASVDDGIPPYVIETNILYDETTYTKASDVSTLGYDFKTDESICFESYKDIIVEIETNEMAKCRYSEEMEDFEDMEIFGLNMYSTTHSLTYFIEDKTYGTTESQDETFPLNFYIKCQDYYGYETPNFFSIEMCSSGYDIEAPEINNINIEEGSFTSFEDTEKDIVLYTNEPAQCRWSNESVSYEQMGITGNNMTCNYYTHFALGYYCNATFETPNAENTYYVNCEDKPWPGVDASLRNSMTTPEVYTLIKPESKIQIDSIEIVSDLAIADLWDEFHLRIETSNGGNEHFCKWSDTGYEIMHNIYEDGSSRIHEVEDIHLAVGDRTVYGECWDETGDFTQDNVSFTITQNNNEEVVIEITDDTTTDDTTTDDTTSDDTTSDDTTPEDTFVPDHTAPSISRVWQAGDSLTVVTDEPSTCRYSTDKCLFDYDNAHSMYGTIDHTTEIIHGEIYYIKCIDNDDNGKYAACGIQVMAI